MSDEPARTRDDEWLGPTRNNVLLVYILYLSSLLVGATALVGVVMAYMYRDKADDVLKSHYTWQIRTFWIALLASLVSALFMVIGIGFLLIMAVAIWAIIRCVKGLQRITNREAIPDPESWMI